MTGGSDDKEPPTVVAGRSKGRPGRAAPEPTVISAAAPVGIRIGDVLNGIFEVRAFIARGGMGEVFEGRNINTEERVAIKVILPALAADKMVEELFLKEARTLTKLSHPALVQYRVMAREPKIGALYIVTDYIEGASLAAVLNGGRLAVDDVLRLGKRLAEGLKAAHDLGAIHRDLSPDNVLLPFGRLDGARVIDFGIAKDASPTTSGRSIIGDGFAGKLGYVAPEQLGDYSQAIGPWTDVYSLGLVLFALATGRAADMGSSIVDAVDRRRAGVSLDAVPERLRPLLTAMLTADPRHRARSMENVIALIDAVPTATEPAPSPTADTRSSRVQDVPDDPRVPTATAVPRSPNRQKRHLIVAALIAAAALGVAFAVRPTMPTLSEARALTSQAAIAMPCAWIEIDDIRATDAGVEVTLRGAVDDPAAAADVIAETFHAAGRKLAGINTSLVAPLDRSACSLVSALASIKAETRGLILDGPTTRIAQQVDGQLASSVSFTIDIGRNNAALLAARADGRVQSINEDTSNRSAMLEVLKAFNATKVGRTTYTTEIHTDEIGWNALLLIRAPGAIETELLTVTSTERDPAWRQAFDRAAREGKWEASMLWFNVQPERPN